MLAPAATVCEPGARLKEKSGDGAAVMLNVAGVLWLVDPLVPLTVRLNPPAGALPVVEMVSVEVPLPAIEAGLKLGEAPAGRPDTPRFTVPLKPLIAVEVTV